MRPNALAGLVASASTYVLAAQPDGKDRVSLPPAELFRVFNPTLATFSQGFLIEDLDDYIARLKTNHPKLENEIDEVVRKNLTPPSEESVRPGRSDKGK